jgi:hypothetical protein
VYPLGQTGLTAVTFFWVLPLTQVMVLLVATPALFLRAVFSFLYNEFTEFWGLMETGLPPGGLGSLNYRVISYSG